MQVRYKHPWPDLKRSKGIASGILTGGLLDSLYLVILPYLLLHLKPSRYLGNPYFAVEHELS
jgi:hypothetical protein